MDFLRKKRLATPKTAEQKRVEMLKRHGVENPQPRNMARNVMLTQVENFNTNKLKPLEHQQRYIISPHDDVNNLFENTLAMSAWGVERKMPAIRPVFKDENQRKKFASMVQNEITSPSIATQSNAHNSTALTMLQNWSTKEFGMKDFKSINTKRGSPIVYVQGHGQPGDQRLRSDTNQYVSASDVGQLLHDKGLPDISQVRANSCYSGTEFRLHDQMPNIQSNLKEQSLDYLHAGKWQNTFAGTVQEKLRSLGKKNNRVIGYMGPTGISPEPVKSFTPLGKLETVKGIAVDLKTNLGLPNAGIDSYKRGQMKRFDPIKDK